MATRKKAKKKTVEKAPAKFDGRLTVRGSRVVEMLPGTGTVNRIVARFDSEDEALAFVKDAQPDQ